MHLCRIFSLLFKPGITQETNSYFFLSEFSGKISQMQNSKFIKPFSLKGRKYKRFAVFLHFHSYFIKIIVSEIFRKCAFGRKTMIANVSYFFQIFFFFFSGGYVPVKLQFCSRNSNESNKEKYKIMMLLTTTPLYLDYV